MTDIWLLLVTAVANPHLLLRTVNRQAHCTVKKKGAVKNPKGSRNSFSTLQGFKTTARTLFPFLNSSVSWQRSVCGCKRVFHSKKGFIKIIHRSWSDRNRIQIMERCLNKPCTVSYRPGWGFFEKQEAFFFSKPFMFLGFQCTQGFSEFSIVQRFIHFVHNTIAIRHSSAFISDVLTLLFDIEGKTYTTKKSNGLSSQCASLSFKIISEAWFVLCDKKWCLSNCSDTYFTR